MTKSIYYAASMLRDVFLYTQLHCMLAITTVKLAGDQIQEIYHVFKSLDQFEQFRRTYHVIDHAFTGRIISPIPLSRSILPFKISMPVDLHTFSK